METIRLIHDWLMIKLERCYQDEIDIILSREQAEKLYEFIHRIIKWDENMKGENNDQTRKDK